MINRKSNETLTRYVSPSWHVLSVLRFVVPGPHEIVGVSSFPAESLRWSASVRTWKTTFLGSPHSTGVPHCG